ncbi:ABC transporter substrate-binding protein [Streptosporangium sp. NBC_01810]|uniref:ABC transporter substrate-binding protein n=1 Tax=Streptosporangium sp. NBC_01810 TaxID=2975951 RepID=UPI002DDA33B7|nr:ABC transporter substrate-binding protein [Streptosporangium sp. NBC_01810]WSA28236.1 ABC transporter substrate-binding protein [Streptosporangium sp. NBC_01810]
MRPRLWVTALTAAVLVISLTACGGTEKSSSEKLTDIGFQTSFLFGGWDIPFFLALDKGYYRDEGLNVTIREGTGSSASIQSLLGGANQIVESDGGSTAILAAEAGGFVSVATLADRFGSTIVSYKSDGIQEPADLKGKSIGISMGGTDAKLLDSFLKVNGVDPSTVTIQSLRPDQKAQYLKARKVDAITFVDYSAVSIEPLEKLNLMRLSEHGISQTGLNLVVRNDWLEEHPDAVRGFLRATAKAFAEARQDPGPAVDALMKRSPVMPAAAATTQWKLYQESFDLDPESKEKGFGRQSDTSWSAMLDSLLGAKIISTTKPLSDYFTNDYLSGER